MLTALDGGIPDRLPASVHGWMQYWLDTYAGGITSEEAYEKFGLDWSTYQNIWKRKKSTGNHWNITVRELEPTDGDRIEETVIETPEKTLRQVRRWDKYHSPWVTEYLFKEPEDVFIFAKWSPDDVVDENVVNNALEITGERGIVRGNRIGPWHELCELYGVEKMIFATFENSGWVHDSMRAMTSRSLRAIKTLDGSKIDLVETGGGHNSSTVVSPSLFRDFILPYEKEIHGLLTGELGIRSVYHTCGGMMPILDMLVEIGSTALETLTPPSLGGDVDLAKLKSQVKGKVSLIGGFDQFNGFQNATPDETRAHVRKCFETAGVGGRYIINPSDHFFDAPVENVEAYAEEASRCVYE